MVMSMKKALFLAALALPTAAAAQAPSSGSSGETAGGNDPNQMICRNLGETGSRLSRNRVCMTRGQWDQQRRETRQNIDRVQTTRVIEGE